MSLQETVKASQHKILVDASAETYKSITSILDSVALSIQRSSRTVKEIEAAENAVLNDIAPLLEDFVFLLSEAKKQCEK